jgi:hypothetical protein
VSTVGYYYDVSAYAANRPNVQVRFRFTDNYGSRWIVDNVQLYGLAATPVYLLDESATGTGIITASFTGGGSGCRFSSPQYIGAPPGAPPVPPTKPSANVVFPHGLFDFSTVGCTPGSTLTFTIVYPTSLAGHAQYFKYRPTATDPTPHWYALPTTVAGSTVSFTITDGGLGDDDLVANGTIVDQGGAGFSSGEPVPALGEWARMLLALLVLAMGGWALRRRP